MHPDPSDNQRCVDINECTLLDNICINGMCENLRGIFKCVCDRGYTLDKTGQRYLYGFDLTRNDQVFP